MVERGTSSFSQENNLSVPNPTQEVKPDPELEKNERTELILQKVSAARNFARDYISNIEGKNYGRMTNLHLIGRILALSIYSPSNIEDLQEYLEKHPESKADIDIITRPLPGTDLKLVQAGDKPFDYEAFATEFGHIASRHNLPKRPEYEDETYDRTVYFDGAEEALEELLKKGPTRVWTAGDTHGLPEEGFKGNNEQYKRAIQGGLHALRLKHRQDSGYDFDVKAAEDKFELLKDMVTDYRKQGVRQYAIVDDKIGNLDKAKAELIRLGVPRENILLVWDRQGSGAPGSDKKMPEGITPEQIKEMEEKYHAIYDIKKLHHTILDNTSLGNLGSPIGTIIDHDDVISDTKKASQIIQENIEDWLKEKEII